MTGASRIGDAFAPERLDGRRVLVLGLGRFSGGVETARFLAAVGARCRIADSASREALADSAAEAEALGAELVFGPQTEATARALLADCEAVIASPAIPFDHPVLLAAWSRGLPVTTEVVIALARSPARVFGVTGTKGKSTTSTLLAAMLAASGRTVHLGGNIGRALIGSLDDIQPDDRVVIELSSFQLWWAHRAAVSPHVTLVTNLFPDHLDRHGTMADYAAAKRSALDFQGPDDLAVLPAADAAVASAGYPTAGRARRTSYGDGGTYARTGVTVHTPEGDVRLDDLALLGRHNRDNALAAAAAALASGDAGLDDVASGAGVVRPLPHRMEPVAEPGGVLYVDDSNATNPRSTLCALISFDRPIVVLLGGKDKGLDPEALISGVRDHAHAVVGIGTTGPALVERLGGLPTAIATTMDAAVSKATALVPAGGVVLLSPGFSSLDQYASFAARGDAFQAAVRALDAARGPA